MVQQVMKYIFQTSHFWQNCFTLLYTEAGEVNMTSKKKIRLFALKEYNAVLRFNSGHELTAIRFNDDEKHELFMTKAFFID